MCLRSERTLGFPFFIKIFISGNTKQDETNACFFTVSLFWRKRKHTKLRYESFVKQKSIQKFVMHHCETKSKQTK